MAEEMGAQRSRAYPYLCWTAVAVYLAAVSMATNFRNRSLPALSKGSLSIYLGGWVGRDSRDYLLIVENGYDRERLLVVFPLYSLLIRVLDVLPGNAASAGIVLTMATGLAAAGGFWAWLDHAGVRGGARTASLGVLLLYPYAWYLYGPVYSDAMFLALAVWAFVLVHRNHLVWAGVVGALATATRPSGYAIAVGLFVVALERAQVLVVRDDRAGWLARLGVPSRIQRQHWRPALAAPLLSWIGLAAYMGYLWVRWDSPMRWITEQSRFHAPGPASELKEQYFSAWHNGRPGSYLASATLSAVLLVVVIVLSPAVGRRFGWGYGIFVLLVAVLPALTVSTFIGVGRYLLVAFPVFALVGEWLAERRALRWSLAAVSVVVISAMAAGFTMGTYLA